MSDLINKQVSFSRTHENDLISRTAAIDALVKDCKASDEGMLNMYDIVCDLKDVPSAQPSSSCSHENDTISRTAAIDALDVLCQEHRYKIPGKLETYSQYNEAWQDALDRAEGAIGNLPPVETATVVRCKDCKFYDLEIGDDEMHLAGVLSSRVI